MFKYLTLVIALFSSSLFAQNKDFTIRYVHPKTGIPGSIKFASNSSNRPSLENTSNWFQNNLNANKNFILKYHNSNTDLHGFKHYRYNQYFNGLKVEGAQIILHTFNNNVLTMNGKYFPHLDINTDIYINADNALQNALKLYGTAIFMWEVKAEEQLLKLQYSNANATYLPKPELVIYNSNDSGKNSDFKVAYKIDVYVHTPISHEIVYIDAKTGEVIDRIDQICTIDKVGIAHTKYSGIRSINCDSVGVDTFILNDVTRGKGIITIDARVISVTDSFRNFIDSDNVWNNVNAYKDEFATDVHWGAEMTYDFYKQTFNRNSYDDSGTKVISKVHVRKNYNNAYWDGKVCNYGDGDGIKYMPLTSLDICGHELSHGVTGNTAQLVYRKESGALNESFSDIMAKCIQYYTDTNNLKWTIADQIVINNNKPFRDMSDPNAYSNPRYYYGLYYYTGNADNGGVHTNSGVQNFWFYLLSKGGKGQREDDKKPYNITALGIEKAGEIAFTNLSSYLVSSSEYIDACYSSLDVCTALYGENSLEYKEVEEAWYAVGVLNTVDIPSNFNVDNQWKVAPNPASDNIQLINPYVYESSDVEIVDITGKSVYSAKVMTNENINISALESGVYFIKVNNVVLKWIKA